MKKLNDFMKISRVFQREVPKLSNQKLNLFVLILFLLYALGVISGSNVNNYLSNELFDYINSILNKAYSNENTSLYRLFADNFSQTLIYILINFALGFCAIGQPLIFLTPFINGVGYGLKQVYMLSQISQNNDYILLFINGISDILITIILIYCCKQSLKLSSYIYKNTILASRKSETAINPISLNSYVTKYFSYAIIIVLINVVRAVVVSLFIG